MYRRHDVPPPLQRLADCQSGVLSREQTLGHDLSDKVAARLIRSGTWQRLGNGLYLTHPLAPSWEALAWGGVLLGGPQSRLGPEASGHLHALVPTAPDPLDVLVPADKPVQSRGCWRFLRERPTARSRHSVGLPPRLGVEDTVLDLTDRRPSSEIVGIVSVAVQRRLTTPDRLRTRLEQRARHTHRALLTEMIADVAEGAQSPLEVRYLRTVERPHGLPRGVRQSSRRGLRHVRDVEYPGFGLLVELDGRDGHVDVDVDVFRDMNRDNQHALLEELTLRYGWFDVCGRPCPVAFQVYRALVRGGYSEPFGRCASCRRVPEHDLLIA